MRSAVSLNSKLFALTAGLLLLVLSPFVGGEPLSLGKAFQSGTPDHLILFELRLPRLLLVVVAGASLAVLGAIYQILFDNPLAEPYLLGISSSVILGNAVGQVVLHLPDWQSTALGCLGAFLVCSVILVVYWTAHADQMYRVILFGVGLQFVFSSALFLLLSYYADSMGGGSLHWLFGRLPWQTWEQSISFSLVLLPFLIGSIAVSRALDALTLGEGLALNLGFPPRLIRAGCIGLTSIWIAILVSFTGAIGFVGLVAPHAVRLVVRPPNTRQLLAWCTLGGAAFLCVADSLSRAFAPPLEFPVGIFTAIVGGPLFLLLLWRLRRT